MLEARPGEGGIGCVAGAIAGAGEVEVRAGRYILSAGEGNEAILRRCAATQPEVVRMQRRPLHMTLVREVEPGVLPVLYGHAIGFSDKPRVTVTTSRDNEGRVVWYVGGQVSEEGVERDRAGQIEAARRELRECLAWLEWERMRLEWGTLRIDRAEGLTPDGSRPDEPVVARVGNMYAAWPTKLAFAPATAERLRGMLEEDGIKAGSVASVEGAEAELAGLPRPPMGEPPWNDRSGRVTWSS
jgi:hypothetical protein